MGRDVDFADQGAAILRELAANGEAAVTVTAPADLTSGAGSYAMELLDALPAGVEFLTIDAAGKWGLNAGGATTLDAAYDSGGPGAGRIITADSGPVEAAGADGFLASHSAPVYGLETTGAERNFRMTAGQTVNIFEIQHGDADGDISDDTFGAPLFALDGLNRRMGLNTVAPAVDFHIRALGSGNAKLRLDAQTAGFDASMEFFEGGTARFELGYDDSRGGLVVALTDFATTDALFIEDTTGDIGINQDDPDAKVHITDDQISLLILDTSAGTCRLVLSASGTTNFSQVGVQASANLLGLVAVGAQRISISDTTMDLGGLTGALIDNVTTINGIGAANLLTLTDSVEIVTAANNPALTIDSAATADPLLVLEPLLATNSRGDINLGQRTVSASAPSEGDLWYDATNHRVEYHEGLQTRALGTRFGPNYGPITDVTIAAGAATVTAGHLRIDGQGGVSDQLDNLLVTGAGPKDGDSICIRAITGITITVSNVGNIRLNGGASNALNSVNDTLILTWAATTSQWIQTGASNNTA